MVLPWRQKAYEQFKKEIRDIDLSEDIIKKETIDLKILRKDIKTLYKIWSKKKYHTFYPYETEPVFAIYFKKYKAKLVKEIIKISNDLEKENKRFNKLVEDRLRKQSNLPGASLIGGAYEHYQRASVVFKTKAKYWCEIKKLFKNGSEDSLLTYLSNVDEIIDRLIELEKIEVNEEEMEKRLTYATIKKISTNIPKDVDVKRMIRFA